MLCIFYVNNFLHRRLCIWIVLYDFHVCLVVLGIGFIFHTDIIADSVWRSEVFVVLGTIDIQYISNKFVEYSFQLVGLPQVQRYQIVLLGALLVENMIMFKSCYTHFAPLGLKRVCFRISTHISPRWG